MARDPKNALVALNRFGFGARGGASGDFVNAASDPRGFVKAELVRPNGVLLEMPGLQSTPALAKVVFEYQFETQQARDAAAKSGAPAAPTEGPPSQGPPDAKPPRRNPSLSSIARWRPGSCGSVEMPPLALTTRCHGIDSSGAARTAQPIPTGDRRCSIMSDSCP